jgi:hypothetical protein
VYPQTPYYIIISLKSQVLLNFLKIRVVVNKKEIFPLINDKPVIIPIEQDNPRIVATDGFHFTRPLELKYNGPGYYKFKVDCIIDDLQLLGAAFLLILFYLAGFFTGILALKILSFVPIVWMLFFYYINRKKFIRIVPGN